MLASKILLALMVCVLLVTINAAPADEPKDDESKTKGGKSSSEEEDSDQHADKKSEGAGDDNASKPKERRDLLINPPDNQGQIAATAVSPNVERMNHNLPGVTHMSIDQTASTTAKDPSIPSDTTTTKMTTTTTERIGFFGPIQSLFP